LNINNLFSTLILMKKGKTVKLNQYESLKTSFGTVDSKNLKSMYINIQTWVCPKKESENWQRVVANLSRDIKHSVYNSINREIFSEKFIVDLDLRTSGIQLNKKSFMNLEINLYTKIELDFKGSQLKELIRKIIKEIYKDCIIRNEYFTFSSSKEKLKIKTTL
jgi:hypothetical protein